MQLQMECRQHKQQICSMQAQQVDRGIDIHTCNDMKDCVCVYWMSKFYLSQRSDSCGLAVLKSIHAWYCSSTTARVLYASSCLLTDHFLPLLPASFLLSPPNFLLLLLFSFLVLSFLSPSSPLHFYAYSSWKPIPIFVVHVHWRLKATTLNWCKMSSTQHFQLVFVKNTIHVHR